MKMFLFFLVTLTSLNASAQIFGLGKKADPKNLPFLKQEIIETDLWTTIRFPKANALAVNDASKYDGVCLYFNRFFGYVPDSEIVSKSKYDNTSTINKHGIIAGNAKGSGDKEKILMEISCYKYKQVKKKKKK